MGTGLTLDVLVRTVLFAAGLGTAAIVWAAARREPAARDRLGWRLLAGWALLTALGQLALAEWYGDTGGSVAAPRTVALDLTVASLAAATLVALAAFAALSRTNFLPGARLRAALDAWVAAGSLCTVVWVLVVAPRLDEVEFVAALWVLLATAALDLSLLAAGVAATAAVPATVRERALLGTLGVLALVVRDAGALAMLLGEPVGRAVSAAGAMGAYALFALCARTRRQAVPIGTRTRRSFIGRSALPYAVAAGAGLVLLATVMRDSGVGTVTLVLVLSVVGALVARQTFIVLDSARLLRELALSEDHFRSLVLGSDDVVVVLDRDGRISYCSPAGEQLLGLPATDLVGRRVLPLVHPDDRRVALAWTVALWREQQRPVRVHVRVRGREGDWRHVESTVSRTERGILVNARDVTERAQLQERLRHLAYHDALTGLPNRAALLEEVAVAIAEPDPGPGRAAVLFLDLDGFKTVNDWLGHEAGDAVLVEAARRLSATVAPGDLVARFGGDEFAVLLRRRSDRAEVLVVAEQIREALSAPYLVGGRLLPAPPSIGVAFADQRYDATRLLRNADLAMYAAKRLPAVGIETYRPELLARAVTQADLSALLVQPPGLERFALLFQPVVALDTGEVVAMEALVRWRSATGELMTPVDLVRLAESSGHIVPLGRWVVTEALRRAAAWRRGGADVELAVNLSVAQLSTEGIVEAVRDALAETGVPPSALTLEITESLLPDDLESAVGRLLALKRLGVRLALDDFGTGYSSLAHLRLLPVDAVKIDRSFVAALSTDPQAEPVLAAAVRLGRDLGLVVTGEGIERPDQAARLLAMGCHRGQGFYYSGPLDDAGVAAALARGTGRPAVAEDVLGDGTDRPAAWTAVSGDETTRAVP